LLFVLVFNIITGMNGEAYMAPAHVPGATIAAGSAPTHCADSTGTAGDATCTNRTLAVVEGSATVGLPSTPTRVIWGIADGESALGLANPRHLRPPRHFPAQV
jgi:streptogramin lyase